MNKDIADKLAAALAEGDDAYADALGEYWAPDGVEIAHEPPLPHDGLLLLEPMLASRKAMGRAFKAAMPDFHHANIFARAIGDVIYLISDQTGALADGTKVNTPLASRFTIENGKIVKVALGIDPPSMQPLRQALEAGGVPEGRLQDA